MASDRFEKLETLYSAIQKLDNSVVEDQNKLEIIMDAVKGIPMSSYPTDCQDKIIASIREALVRLYTEEIKLLGERIEVKFLTAGDLTEPSGGIAPIAISVDANTTDTN